MGIASILRQVRRIPYLFASHMIHTSTLLPKTGGGEEGVPVLGVAEVKICGVHGGAGGCKLICTCHSPMRHTCWGGMHGMFTARLGFPWHLNLDPRSIFLDLEENRLRVG